MARISLVTGGTRGIGFAVATALLQAGDHVFVIEPDDQGKDRAHERAVETGTVLGDAVILLSGVSAGERVAALGSFKLREGVLVAVTESEAVATSSAPGGTSEPQVPADAGDQQVPASAEDPHATQGR